MDQLQWDSASADEETTPPRHVSEELLGIVPADDREPYDVREVIARLVDGSEFLEFKAPYSSDTVCGHARIAGQRIGIIGNYGPCGRGFDPRFIFAWPSARTAVMGGAQAAMVMDIVNRAKLERAGQPVNDEALKAMSDQLKQRLDKESTALFGTARLWDDGI